MERERVNPTESPYHLLINRHSAFSVSRSRQTSEVQRAGGFDLIQSIYILVVLSS